MSPIKGVRYRYKYLGKTRRQRLAFKNNKVKEITGFKKVGKRWKKTYTKRFK